MKLSAVKGSFTVVNKGNCSRKAILKPLNNIFKKKGDSMKFIKIIGMIVVLFLYVASFFWAAEKINEDPGNIFLALWLILLSFPVGFLFNWISRVGNQRKPNLRVVTKRNRGKK